MARTAGRRTCEPRPLAQAREIRSAAPVGATTWDPADRTVLTTARAASAESEVRPGPRPRRYARTAPKPGSRAGSTSYSLPADSDWVGRWLVSCGVGAQIHQFFARPARPADRLSLASAMRSQRQPDSLDVIGGGNAASGVPVGLAPHEGRASRLGRGTVFRRGVAVGVRPLAQPLRIGPGFIRGRVPHHRAGPGRTRARRWPRVRCAAGWRGRSPRNPGSTSPGHACGPR